MANGRGYNKYQYETSPRKLKPEYEPVKTPYKKKTTNTNKSQKKQIKSKKSIKIEKIKKAKLVFSILLVFGILLAISYKNSQINEKFNHVQTLKKELALLQKENEQTQVSIENMLNLNNIEQAAKERLGMQKLNNRQTQYISLDKKDYVVPATEKIQIDQEKNIIQKVIDAIIYTIM